MAVKIAYGLGMAMSVSVALSAYAAPSAGDDGLDGFSSLVVEMSRYAPVEPASAPDYSSCSVTMANELETRVADLSALLNGLQDDLPLTPAQPIADKVILQEQSMIAELSAMEQKLEDRLKAQIAALDAESAKLTAQLNTLRSRSNSDRDNKALEAILNAEKALETARAALREQR